MEKLALFCIVLSAGFFALAAPSLATPTISFVSGDCTGGLTCVFSINSTENSHVGECGYYGTSVCVNFTSATFRQNACTPGTETPLLSLFQRNDSHVGVFGISNYGNLSCVAPTIGVTVKSSCGGGETCLISLNATNNSHVGDCDYYGLQLCLGPPDATPPTITVQSPTNTTYFTFYETVSAEVTVNEIASNVFRNVDGGSNVSLSNSSGSWNGQLTGLSTGPHSVTFYANDTSNNHATPQTVYFTVDTAEFELTLLSPSNQTYRGNSVQVTVSTNRQADWCGRSLDGGSNTTMTETSATQWDETLTLDEGVYNVIVYCNDTGGNMAATSRVYFTVNYDTLVITGSSFYLATGVRVSSGTVTATILETGSTNSTTVSNGRWDVSLTSPTAFQDRRATIGIFVNESSGRSGYYTLVLGTGQAAAADTACTDRAYRFSGTAVDPSVGSLSSSGTVRVDVVGTAYSNSTSYSGGSWEVYVTLCIVKGEPFDADILVTDSGGQRARVLVRQVAA